jgi:hypothetical protein
MKTKRNVQLTFITADGTEWKTALDARVREGRLILLELGYDDIVCGAIEQLVRDKRLSLIFKRRDPEQGKLL